MKTVHQFLVFAAISLLIISCNSKKQTDYLNSKADLNHLDLQKLALAIQFEMEELPSNSDSINKQLKHWYKIHNYGTAWFQANVTINKIDTLLGFISQIGKHGLKPEQLAYVKLLELTKELKKRDFTYLELAKLEIKASLAYIRYCGGMKFGFINPQISCSNYFLSFQQIDSAFINSCFTASNKSLKFFLVSIQPKSKTYLELQSKKDKYQFLVDSTFTPIPLLPEKETIKLGAIHSSIPLIARRLMITGELAFNPNYKTDYQCFDQNILNALNAFRSKNGQLQDEEIGNKTINALNISFDRYIDKINVNLERLRWKPAEPCGEKYIRVNVAAMTLTAYQKNNAYLNMKVCVGKPENKTPFLQSRIHELILNPTWTVPNSIIIKEYSKIGIADSGYFNRHSIRAFKEGKEVNTATIEWGKISKTYQPYKLVQDSGDVNSLGRLKFNFNNPFSVYLHDTNSKSTFRKHFRAVSHGCIRIEKPLDLAFFCLPEINPNINPLETERQNLLKAKIRYSMNVKVIRTKSTDSISTNSERMKLKRVGLNPSVPIVIDYQTCFSNQTGEVVFTDDIYNFDKELSLILHRIKL
jgi:murein L,D-transpeptidase YcbB/YkuD